MRGSPTRTVLLMGLAGLVVLALVVALYPRAREDDGPAEVDLPAPPALGGRAEAAPGSPDDDVVPHPLFPTAERTGTDGLFDLEQPERGPEAPGLQLPRNRAGLRWTTYQHCEVDHDRLRCGGSGDGRAAALRWRVGRGASRELAERMLHGRVHGTVLLERGKGGKPARIARFDRHGELDWVRILSGKRYSARRRNGANQLEGCGHIELARIDGSTDEVVCLQWLLRPMKDAGGVAIRRLHRDSAGFVVEERRYGTDRKPVEGTDGVHRVVTRRDAVGRRTKVLGFDLEGKAVVSTASGCHARETVYDGSGLVSEVRCFGVDGRLAPDKDEVAIVRYEHDDRGCRVADIHLDARARPVASAVGVQVIRRELDALCETRRESCHHDGRVACGPGQPAELRFQRDRRGLVTRARHYGPAGRPDQDPEYGAFELRFRHDRRGNKVAESCFDQGGRPVICGNTGFHRVEGRFDAAGRKIEDRFFDVEGKPTTNLGTFVRRFHHDAYDHLRETRDFDEPGELVESLGAASRRYLYDESHQLFGLLQFDRVGRPAEFRGCITGHTCPPGTWHAVRVVRSPKGRAVRNLFFDGERRLIHRSDCARAKCWR